MLRVRKVLPFFDLRWHKKAVLHPTNLRENNDRDLKNMYKQLLVKNNGSNISIHDTTTTSK